MAERKDERIEGQGAGQKTPAFASAPEESGGQPFMANVPAPGAEGADGRELRNVPWVEGHGVDEYTVTREKEDEATAGVRSQIKTLNDFLEANRLESEEDRRKREKRERARKIISSLGDGLSAISNLVFTGRRAPDMLNTDLTGRLGKELDRAKAERERLKEQHLNYALKIGDLKGRENEILRQLQADAEKRRQAANRDRREGALHPLKMNLLTEQGKEAKEKTRKAGAEADKAGVEAEYAPQIQKGKVELLGAQTQNQIASAGKNNAQAVEAFKKGNAADRSNTMEYRAWDRYGNEVYFKNEKAAIQFAEQEGTAAHVQDVSTNTTATKRKPDDKRPKVTTKTTSKNRTVPANPANRPPLRQGGATGGSSRTGNNNSNMNNTKSHAKNTKALGL